MHRSVPRALAAIAAGAALALAAPLAASAHVTVSPDSADPGDFASVTFNAPTESETASTVKLEIDLPADHPFAYVLWEPVPGWTVDAPTVTLPKPVTSGDGTVTTAVTKVTWTAAGEGIPPGAIQHFGLTLGPVPDVPSLSFPAHQHYSDGTVVDWDDASEDDEHPAPVLHVTDAPPDDRGSAAGTTGGAVGNDAPTVSDRPDTVARVLGILGLVVGAAGVVVAALALRRRTGDRT